MISLSGQIGNTESELKKLAEENPDLQEAYIAKQKRLKVSRPGVLSWQLLFVLNVLPLALFLELLLLKIAGHQHTIYLWLMLGFQKEFFFSWLDIQT